MIHLLAYSLSRSQNSLFVSAQSLFNRLDDQKSKSYCLGSFFFLSGMEKRLEHLSIQLCVGVNRPLSVLLKMLIQTSTVKGETPMDFIQCFKHFIIILEFFLK